MDLGLDFIDICICSRVEQIGWLLLSYVMSDVFQRDPLSCGDLLCVLNVNLVRLFREHDTPKVKV